MTLPIERFGDKGQRYLIQCDEYEGGPSMDIGYANCELAFEDTVFLHPSWCNHRAIDREES